MEKEMCYNCGEETPNVLSRCVHCGHPIAKTPTENFGRTFPSPPPYPNNATTRGGTPKKQRNGFVSFYLWLSFIGGCVDAAVNLLFLVRTQLDPRDVTDVMHPDKVFDALIQLLFAIPIIAGFWQLMQWKRLGYKIITVALIVWQCICISLYRDTVLVFLPGLSLLFLFLVLQIKKNGKSCWSQLS